MIEVTETVIIAECGARLRVGDRAYDYYSMEPGVIEKLSGGFDGWFDFRHDNGERVLLNGQRICSMRFARLRGFRNADPA